jgi:hemoglobin-like flavoprotein
VCRSRALIEPLRESAARDVYARLFTIEPSLESLFGGSLQAQGDKLMHTLYVVIVHLKHLKHLKHLVPLLLALHQLALRHLDWQVRPECCDRVGEAQGVMLTQCLGEHFTPALDEAWRVAYPHESCAG